MLNSDGIILKLSGDGVDVWPPSVRRHQIWENLFLFLQNVSIPAERSNDQHDEAGVFETLATQVMMLEINRGAHLPWDLFHRKILWFQNLRVLVVEDIEYSLGEGITKLPLETLVFSHTGVSVLPRGFNHLNCLKILNLQRNPGLTGAMLHAIWQLPDLRSLDLSYDTGVVTLEIPHSHCAIHLRRINLAWSGLRHWPNFHFLPNLRILSLQGARFRRVPAIAGDIRRLFTLDLSFIRNAHPLVLSIHICALQQLIFLDLRGTYRSEESLFKVLFLSKDCFVKPGGLGEVRRILREDYKRLIFPLGFFYTILMRNSSSRVFKIADLLFKILEYVSWSKKLEAFGPYHGFLWRYHRASFQERHPCDYVTGYQFITQIMVKRSFTNLVSSDEASRLGVSNFSRVF